MIKKYNDIIDALDSVTWYNCLAEYVFKWTFLEPESNNHILPPSDKYGGEVMENEYQLQVLWMIAVNLFGDYGTSPRYAWIENVDGFRNWCLAITRTWRSSDEYTGPERYREYD